MYFPFKDRLFGALKGEQKKEEKEWLQFNVN